MSAVLKQQEEATQALSKAQGSLNQTMREALAQKMNPLLHFQTWHPDGAYVISRTANPTEYDSAKHTYTKYQKTPVKVSEIKDQSAESVETYLKEVASDDSFGKFLHKLGLIDHSNSMFKEGDVVGVGSTTISIQYPLKNPFHNERYNNARFSVSSLKKCNIGPKNANGTVIPKYTILYGSDPDNHAFFFRAFPIYNDGTVENDKTESIRECVVVFNRSCRLEISPVLPPGIGKQVGKKVNDRDNAYKVVGKNTPFIAEYDSTLYFLRSKFPATRHVKSSSTTDGFPNNADVALMVEHKRACVWQIARLHWVYEGLCSVIASMAMSRGGGDGERRPAEEQKPVADTGAGAEAPEKAGTGTKAPEKAGTEAGAETPEKAGTEAGAETPEKAGDGVGDDDDSDGYETSAESKKMPGSIDPAELRNIIQDNGKSAIDNNGKSAIDSLTSVGPIESLTRGRVSDGGSATSTRSKFGIPTQGLGIKGLGLRVEYNEIDHLTPTDGAAKVNMLTFLTTTNFIEPGSTWTWKACCNCIHNYILSGRADPGDPPVRLGSHDHDDMLKLIAKMAKLATDVFKTKSLRENDKYHAASVAGIQNLTSAYANATGNSSSGIDLFGYRMTQWLFNELEKVDGTVLIAKHDEGTNASARLRVKLRKVNCQLHTAAHRSTYTTDVLIEIMRKAFINPWEVMYKEDVSNWPGWLKGYNLKDHFSNVSYAAGASIKDKKVSVCLDIKHKFRLTFHAFKHNVQGTNPEAANKKLAQVMARMDIAVVSKQRQSKGIQKKKYSKKRLGAALKPVTGEKKKLLLNPDSESIPAPVTFQFGPTSGNYSWNTSTPFAWQT